MIKKILVANRGEIAVRVMRSCREMEITSIAIFSEADRTAKHVLYADEAYCVGPAASKESYLNIEKIIEVAKAAHADAIHPGYGFLSENATFARRCQEEGIIFIGPNPETMEAMGDKIAARIKMIEAGVPVVPGTQDNLKSVEEAIELCNKIGYPVMLKASMGGGGKGMRLIHSAEEVEEAYRRASGAETIVESLGLVHRLTSDTAAGAVSHALQSMQRITGFGDEIRNLQEELLQIEGLLDDFNHETADYMQDFSFDANEFSELEKRLDTIHNLQAKYGSTYEEILSHLEEVEDKLQKLADFEQYKEKLLAKIKEYESDLTKKCEQLSKERKETASILQEKIKAALSDLNFAYVDFEISWSRKDTFGVDGWDEAEFLIATNPGEPKKSLGKIASGGELSRIMLAIKSVFAEKDHIETLIFDEIDTGISGQTAMKVAEKMAKISRNHQVICISHLSQIAAMADSHYLIKKTADENSTKS